MSVHSFELLGADTKREHFEKRVGSLGVQVQTLVSGLGRGMQVIELSAGNTKVSVLPQRGMGIWKMISGELTLGWNSPVRGPVNPACVPLSEPSGLGWLDGFDELVARCGLVNNGAPDFDSQGKLLHGLHGRIANLPAHSLNVSIDDAAGTITLAGAVDETRFLVQSLQMKTSLVLSADRPCIEWTDTIENLSDRPTTFQMLYHINFGPPLLGAGAELVAAVEELAPRDAGSMSDIGTWNRYDSPCPGRAEQVHFATIRSHSEGVASAMLVAPDAKNAVCVAWRADTLPCFALWKNQGGLADGYVTGLEPATNFPNARSFEESQGRVVALGPHESVRFDLSLEHLSGSRLIERRKQIEAVMASRTAKMHEYPRSGWSAGASANR